MCRRTPLWSPSKGPHLGRGLSRAGRNLSRRGPQGLNVYAAVLGMRRFEDVTEGCPAMISDGFGARSAAGERGHWSGFVDSGVHVHVVPTVGVEQGPTPYAFQSEARLLGDAARCGIGC